MRPRRRNLALGLILLAAMPVALRSDAQLLRFDRLTPDDGLSQGFVNDFAQDSFGFVWIATQDGLNRYDGYEVRVFRPEGEGSLQDSHIRALAPGPDGGLWVGSREGGLSLWDPASETFRTWRNRPNDPTSLVFDSVRDLFGEPDGTLWIGTLEGLSRFDKGRATFRSYARDPANPSSLSSNDVGRIYRDSAGTLWVALRSGALDSLAEDGTFRHRRADLDAAGAASAGAEAAGAGASAAPSTGSPSPAVPPIGNVTSVASSRGGKTYLGTSTGALVEWNPKEARFRRVPEVQPGKPVTSLVEDAAGVLWIGTRGAGLLRYDPRTGSLLAARFDASDPHSVPSDDIQTLFVDATGVLWVGTAVGAARHDPRSAAFRVLRRGPAADGPVGTYVWAVESDRDGNLWVGCDGGLSLRTRADGRWTSFTPNPEDPKALPSDSVTAVAVDREGAVWVGGNRGVSRLAPGSALAAAPVFETFTKDSSGLPNDRVFDLLETRDGALLVATARGVAQWDPASRTFSRLGGDGFLATVFSMAEDADGAIWLGSFHNGLYRLDRKTQALTRLADAKGTNLVSPQEIHATMVDGSGRLWVGTSQGVFRRGKDTSEVVRYRAKDGLPNESIMGFVEDARGAIWIATNDGIARLDPDLGTFRVYKARDGLPSNELNQMAAGRTPDGDVLFGTPAGAVMFRPEELVPDPEPPRVVLSGLELFGRPVPIRPAVEPGKGEDFSLRRSILTTERLLLTHRENVLTFAFVGLHFAAPRELRYAFQLEGWDREWRDLPSQRRTASYTNLPDGRFVFRVKAANKDGVWSEPTSLPVRVLPPPWKTWWAYASYALVLAAALAGFVRFRIRALERRQRDLEALVQVRTAELEASERRALEANQAKSVFLANMSHELRTPLNAVLGFAQLLEKSPALRGDDRSGLEIIRRSGEHLLGLINDVLSISKIEAGRLTLDPRPFRLRNLIEGLNAMMRGRAERAGLRLEVNVEGELPEAVTGDEGKLRQALVNLLGNALKFTEKGGVTLRASWREGRARFEVEDTGAGIAAAELETLFEPFVQTESGRRSKEGTGLGLAITRQIVRLMDGDIIVRSRPGAGSCFTVDVALPLYSGGSGPAREEGRVVGLAAGEPPRRILVADDTPENRLLVVRLLGSVGFTVEEARDGAEAVRAWERRRPDLVFMDIRMPVLDGREATRRIRELEKSGAGGRTPIVALTASAFEHEREEILSHGADDFLLKPFREDELFRMLEKHTGVKLARVVGEDSGRLDGVKEEGVTRERLAGLRAEEVGALREALERGDVAKAAAVAAEIGRRDPVLGREIQREIDDFQIDRLLGSLEGAST